MFNPDKIIVSDQPCAWGNDTGRPYRCHHVQRLASGELVEARLISMDGASALHGSPEFLAQSVTTDAPVSWTKALGLDSEGPATPEEEAEVDTNKSVMLQEIASLKREVERLTRMRDGFRNDIEHIKSNVSGWFSDQVSTGEMTRAKANAALKAMGLSDMLLVGDYVVTVKTGNGTVIGTRTVAAEDEDAAVELVTEEMEVTGYVRRVRWVINLGDGEDIERFENHEQWDEWQVHESDEQQFIDALEITAEEEA